MREAPSGSELPTFFRWCLGGMAAMASGSASRSAFARDAHARVHERVLRVTRQTEVECGDISAAQEELLARAPLLGGDGASAPDADAVADGVAVDADAVDSDERALRLLTEHTVKAGGISASQEDLLARAPLLGGNGEEAEAAEVFSTPPAQVEQSPPQQGQGEKGEAVINMCAQSFTQLSPSPASSSPSVSKKRRLIRTPTPSPSPSSPPSPSPPPSSYVHPLYNAFVMIPSAPLPPADGDFLELALKHGIF